MDVFLAACAAELRLAAPTARALAGAMLLRIRRTGGFDAYVRALSRVPGALFCVTEARRRSARLRALDPLRRRRLKRLFFETLRRHAIPSPLSA